MSTELTKNEKGEITKPKHTEKELQYTYNPKIDIVESEKELVLYADMPGVDEKSVSIDLEGNELSVTGMVNKITPDDRELTYREYIPSSFKRDFTLGNAIDRSKIKATVKDGVLMLVLPKAKEMQPKKIQVKAG